MNNIISGGTQVVLRVSRVASSVRSVLTAVHVSHRAQIIFCKRLSMMLRADMPITAALQLMATEAKKKPMQLLLHILVAEVSAGTALSVALQKSGFNLSLYSINVIRAGEASGALATNLEYLANELKKKHELRTQIRGSLVYPAVVLMATIGITVFLLVYIFPKILPIFLSLKTDLPLSTRILMNLSDGLVQYGWWIVAASMGMFFVCFALVQVSGVRRVIDVVLLRLPVFGKLCQYYNIATISRTLGLLLKNEVRINEALSIVADSTENMLYSGALRAARTRVTVGKTLASCYQEYPQLWPTLVVQMIQTGEATGTLASTCGYLSEMYESDIRDWTKTMTVLLEPLLMIGMGLSVGFIAISIITPIYGITAQLHS